MCPQSCRLPPRTRGPHGRRARRWVLFFESLSPDNQLQRVTRTQKRGGGGGLSCHAHVKPLAGCRHPRNQIVSFFGPAFLHDRYPRSKKNTDTMMWLTRWRSAPCQSTLPSRTCRVPPESIPRETTHKPRRASPSDQTEPV